MLKNSWLSLPTNPEQHWRSLCKRPGWKLFSMVLKQWCEKVLLPALMLWELHASSRSRAIVGTWRRLGSLVKWPHALRSWKLSHENLECVFVSLKKKAFPFWGMVVKKTKQTPNIQTKPSDHQSSVFLINRQRSGMPSAWIHKSWDE